jgi:hypothetical protein
MRWRIRIALILFAILSISTFAYGGYVIYRNHYLSTYEGTTDLTGMVVYSDDRPVEGAVVRSDGFETETDSEGKFNLEDVDVGIVDLEIYKKGYIPLEIRWLAYPRDEVENDFEDSPNNISIERRIELLLEKEEIVREELPENGTFSLMVNPSENSELLGKNFHFGLLGGDTFNETVSPERKSYDLEGNGTFFIEVPGTGERIVWKNLPGSETNITPVLEKMYGFGDDPETEKFRLDIVLSEPLNPSRFELEVIDPLEGSVIFEGEFEKPVENISFHVNPGLGSIILTGRDIRDRKYSNILINSTGENSYEIEVIEAEPERMLEDLDLSWNYTIGGVYLALSIIFIAGIYLTLKGTKWTYILVIALAGFLVRGLYIGPVPLNLIISLILVMIIIFSKEDIDRRKRK